MTGLHWENCSISGQKNKSGKIAFFSCARKSLAIYRTTGHFNYRFPAGAWLKIYCSIVACLNCPRGRKTCGVFFFSIEISCISKSILVFLTGNRGKTMTSCGFHIFTWLDTVSNRDEIMVVLARLSWSGTDG